MTVVLTGAAGFIGANLVHHLRKQWPETRIISVDKLTHGSCLAYLDPFREDERHVFVRADIADRTAMQAVFDEYEPSGVLHLAAESHVDRSITDPLAFVHSNLVGTANLLDVARRAWKDRTDVRFLHVSTDEVFGELGETGLFSESTSYDPSSPYSATKAGSDHLVRAWHRTYGLPVLITNCCNNYGRFQFPEKLIPVVIGRALNGEPVPVYGQGTNVRDWLHVDDHCSALATVFESGTPGRTYCVGARAEATNIDLVHRVLDLVDELTGRDSGSSRSLIEFVRDRPGHDFRYGIDPTRLESELDWKPSVSLADGLRRTVAWYVENQELCTQLRSGNQEFEAAWYADRGGRR